MWASATPLWLGVTVGTDPKDSRAAVRLADPIELCKPTAGIALIILLDDLALTLTALSNAVTTAWLTHIAPSRAFAREEWRPTDDAPSRPG